TTPRRLVMRTLPPYLCLCLLLVLASPARLIADPIVIDFEGLQDGTILSNQYSGVTFSNAIILTAGISLNEFEFPPLSGTNVASGISRVIITGDTSGGSFTLDDATYTTGVTAVPEPGTIFLLLAGIVFLGLRRLRLFSCVLGMRTILFPSLFVILATAGSVE